MKKVLENVLKNYKKNKSVVEMAQARIDAWEAAIMNPEMILEVFSDDKSNSCWIGGGGYTKHSVVENEVMKKITRCEDESMKKEKYVEILKEYIKREKSKAFMPKLEISQVESMLSSLTNQERYVVECKYFENMSWGEIEIKINEKYRQKNYITTSGIRKINFMAIDKLIEVLEQVNALKVV